MFHLSSFRIRLSPARVCSLLLGLLSVVPLLGQSFMENRGQVRDQFGAPNPAVHYLLETPNNTITLR